MQETLYPLSVRDVESIGKSRANRDIPKNLKYYIYGGVIVAFIGVIYTLFKADLIGIVVAAVGAIVLWYGTIKADSRRKIIINKLKQEWREEQLKSQVK